MSNSTRTEPCNKILQRGKKPSGLFFRITGIFCVCLWIPVSCGLDVYYYLEPPVLLSQPTDEAAYQYYQFQTNDSANSSAAIADVFRGYVVFYRIYNSSGAVDSDNTAIQARNTLYSSSAAEALQSYGYQQMRSSSGQVPLIGKEGNVIVTIRLYERGSSGVPYMPGIFFRNSSHGIPLRYNGKTFDFFGTDSGAAESVPLSGDFDVRYTAGSGETTWYVNAYAVTYGMNMYFSPLYSSVIYLGKITILK